MEEKVCTKCKQSKSRSEFRARTGPKANKDGLNSSCKECDRIENEKYRLQKKLNNPLKTCKVCKVEKHYSLFEIHPGSRGTICLECSQKIKEQKELEQNKKTFDHLVQHKDSNKRCSKCRLFKPFEEFWKSKHTSDGFYSSCIECTKFSQAQFIERYRKNKKNWTNKNLNHIREYQNNWDKNRRKTDPVYNLKRNVMHAITASIRKYGFENLKTQKLEKAIFDHLPYTSERLKSHIESLWEPWMSWDNYGLYDAKRDTWQIDHIYPQSKLPYSNMEDENFTKCWALGNLQPLKTTDNISKSNKV